MPHQMFNGCLRYAQSCQALQTEQADPEKACDAQCGSPGKTSLEGSISPAEVAPQLQVSCVRQVEKGKVLANIVLLLHGQE